MIHEAGCSCWATLIIALSCLFSYMMFVKISSKSAEKKSAIADTRCWMRPQIFSVTESSTVRAVISRNRPPMVSYDSNLLTISCIVVC